MTNSNVLKAKTMKSFSLAILSLLFCSYVNAQESDVSNADSDADGKVTISEFEEYAEGRLPGFEHLQEFAKKVDADGDGEISKEEFGNRMEVLQALRTSGAEDDDSDEMPAQDKKKETKKDTAAKTAFEKMSKLVAENKLQDAAEFMTKKAQDEFASIQVISSIGMLEMEMPVPMPKFEDAIENVDDVLIKYDLDELEIDHAKFFRVEMSTDDPMDDDDEDDGDEDDADSEKSEKKSAGDKKADPKDDESDEVDEIRTEVLQILDKDGKRWEIVQELVKAKSGTIFGLNPLTGKVNGFEMQDENTAFLELAGAEHENDEGGAMIQMVMPPTIVVMKKMDNDWKYAGRDEERTNKAVKEFMQEQRRGFGGGRTDF